MVKKWIQGAIKHPGALHRELHVKEGEKIPKAKLAKGLKRAKKTGNTKLEKRINLAKTLSGMRKVGGRKK